MMNNSINLAASNLATAPNASNTPASNTTRSMASSLSKISPTIKNRTPLPPSTHSSMRAAALAVMGAQKIEALVQDVDITATEFRLNLLKLIKSNQEPSDQRNSDAVPQNHQNLLNGLIANVNTVIGSNDSNKSHHLNQMLPAFVRCFPKAAESSGDLLNCLSPIMQQDQFSQSLSTQQHKTLVRTIGKQLTINDGNRETLLSLTLSLLSKNDANLKPYIETFLSQLLNSLPKNGAENGERETILYKLTEQPGFLAHLDTRQQHQLMSLFKQKIAAPFHSSALNSPENLAIHQQRATYLHLATLFMDKQLGQASNGLQVSHAHRNQWFLTLNKAVGNLHYQSLHLKKDWAQSIRLISSSLMLFASTQAETSASNIVKPASLHSALIDFRDALKTYKTNHFNHWYNIGFTTRSINKMMLRLDQYEQLVDAATEALEEFPTKVEI